jgi:hypothetical protein
MDGTLAFALGCRAMAIASFGAPTYEEKPAVSVATIQARSSGHRYLGPSHAPVEPARTASSGPRKTR